MRTLLTFRGITLLALLSAGCLFAQHRAQGPGMSSVRTQPMGRPGMLGPSRSQAGMGWTRPQPDNGLQRVQDQGSSAMQRPPEQAAAPVVRQAPQQSFQQQRPAPIERRAPGKLSAHPRRNGEHLSEWLSQHRNMPLPQQERALEKEPGFQQLPPQAQQRYRNLLGRLNAMSPQERERWTAHTEAMERLTVGQRAQVRGAMQQLGSLPPEQRRVVARSFRQLRRLSPDQRAAMMDSGAYQSQMNQAQRDTLNNLMRIEPMLPPE